MGFDTGLDSGEEFSCNGDAAWLIDHGSDADAGGNLADIVASLPNKEVEMVFKIKIIIVIIQSV